MRHIGSLRRSPGGARSLQPLLYGGAPRSLIVAVFALALLTLTACAGSNNSNNKKPPTANSARGDILGVATYKPTAASYTPIPTVASAGTSIPLPSGTPPVGVPDPCAGLSNGPQAPNATLPPATPIPPFTPGPQPARPPIDLTTLKLSPGTIPADEDPFQDGKFTAVEIAQANAYPAYAYAYLQTIGLLAGRALSWTAPPAAGRTPLLTVIYYVFGNDAGASTFLHAPLFPASFCTKTEPGATLGQEAAHYSYQYANKLSTGNQGIFEGHRVLWRCGRVLLSVEEVGAPGQYSAASVDAIAQKVQSDFTKTQSCS